jgi:CRP/FNR family transcriptional regulator
MVSCGLTRLDMKVANDLVYKRLRVRRGEYLYWTDDCFNYLYVVRSGFFKTTLPLKNGQRTQVTAFMMPGDLMGMSGIGPGRYTCNSNALVDSSVCAIAFDTLEELSHTLPNLQRQFAKTMSREIVRENGVMLKLGTMNAEERLAIFLLNLSKRYAARGESPTELNLPMTRDEIGSYLGLKLETVSRTLSRLQENGLIIVQVRFIRILDISGLERVIARS